MPVCYYRVSMSVYLVTSIFLTLVGLTFGSFVNAAVWRMHKRKTRTLLNDRSECTHCHHKLAWNDLIPVISWVTLRGRCRYCGKRIEDTPMPEIGVAIFFLVSFLYWPGGFTTALSVTDFVFWLVFGVLLAILFIYDLRYMLLPDRVTFLLIGLAVIQLIVHIVLAPTMALDLISNAILGVASVAGIYLLLYVVSSGRWVGFGDVKLSVFFGIVLADWKLGLLTILLANLIGCIVILPGLASRKLKRTSRVPFGPFLILGFILAMLFGRTLVDWYISSLHL